MTVLASVPPPLLSISGGAVLKIAFTGGRPNALCTLQSTSDLNAWADFETVTTDAGGFAKFYIPFTNAPSSQFYRVRIAQ